MSRNYKFYNPSAAYFVSFATVNWIDVFRASSKTLKVMNIKYLFKEMVFLNATLFLKFHFSLHL